MLPRRDATELDWLIFEQAGLLTTAQAVAALGWGVVRGRVRRGLWRSVCRGIVLTCNGQMTRDQQLWAAVLASGPGALLAGATAAAEGGVRGLRTTPVQVLIPACRMPSTKLGQMPDDMAGVRVYRTTVLPPEHRHPGSPPRTATARSVIDAAAWAGSDHEARTAIVAACQQRLVMPQAMLEVLRVLPKVRRRRLMRLTLADIQGGAQALSEIDLVELCRRFQLPLPDQQVRRTDRTGRNRYLDGYWKRWRLHVEVDGAHHMDATNWAADMLRQNQIWIAGDRILRFPAFVVRERSADVAHQLRAALTAAGWSQQEVNA
jgi:very-short-patch-repair endonuclease